MAHLTSHLTPVTASEYFALPDEHTGDRIELIEGELVVTPSPTVDHQGISGHLYLLLVAWVRRGARGRVYYAPLDVLLSNYNVLQPDLIWVAPDRLDVISTRYLTAAPDLAVEILSPSTARRDREVKARLYFQFGVREYWLVDPAKQRLTMFVRGPDGFVSHADGSVADQLVSSLSADLVVVPRDLFEAELFP